MAHKMYQRWSRARSGKACKESCAMFLFHFILTENYYLQGPRIIESQATCLRSDTNIWTLILTEVDGFGFLHFKD